MGDGRFDQLTRTVAAASSRRQLLMGLAGAALGGLLSRARPAPVDAAPTCRGPGRHCMQDANCCANSTCDPATHRCVCNPGFLACGNSCIDPTSDVANCGGCGKSCPTQQCKTAICQNSICGTLPDPQQNSQPCDDGNNCTTGDICQSGTCTGTPVDCSQFVDACHTSVCNSANGTCNTQTLADDAPCDTGDLCDVDPTCQAGVCTPQQTIQCLICGTCDGNGGCDAVPDGTSCGGPTDVCVNGACKSINCIICSHLEGISCVADPDGTSCGGPNDVCVNGGCQSIQCIICSHLEGISCVADPDNTPCGQNAVCINGGCALQI